MFVGLERCLFAVANRDFLYAVCEKKQVSQSAGQLASYSSPQTISPLKSLLHLRARKILSNATKFSYEKNRTHYESCSAEQFASLCIPLSLSLSFSSYMERYPIACVNCCMVGYSHPRGFAVGPINLHDAKIYESDYQVSLLLAILCAKQHCENTIIKLKHINFISSCSFSFMPKESFNEADAQVQWLAMIDVEGKEKSI